MKLSIVIPVYNEVNTILEILRRIKTVPMDKEIIIVDDGSTDGTQEILKEINDDGIRIFFNEKNRGKGFTLKKGFEHINGDIAIIQDADLEYYPSEYPILTQKIVEGKADVVYGTRFLGGRRVFNFYHYIGNQTLNLIANILYNTNLTDMMTCYKVFRADILKRLKLRAKGFGIEAEITAQIFKLHLKVYEVPISYDGRDYEEGKKCTWRDFFRSVYWLIKCKFESFDVGEETLYRMRLMKNNNKWIFKLIKPYLGSNILEVGSGIGNISRFLTALNRNLVLTDVKENYLDFLKHRFIGNPKVKMILHNISSSDPSFISPYGIDTVVCINALEHVKDDQKALENVYKILNKNGRLILIVPALNALYGSIDEKLGHFRRYDKVELIRKLEQKKFLIEQIYYHNFISAIGWFVNSRILRIKVMSNIQVALLDKFIPFIAIMEKRIKIPFGLSLVAICKKS